MKMPTVSRKEAFRLRGVGGERPCRGTDSYS
jgi:hypothetical protein